MADKYETSIYTKSQLDNARIKGQVKGWAQGAASTFLLVLLWSFIGAWIPAVIILGLLGFLGYKFSTSRKKSAS